MSRVLTHGAWPRDAAARAEAFVLLNPAAAGGRAGALYASLEPELCRRFAPTTSTVFDRWRDALADALAAGVRLCVAAGGDGTVHALVNALVDCGAGAMPPGVALGAIGLGSSNDFHKPASGHLRGLPVRLALERASPHDLVRVQYRARGGASAQRCFIVSASIGLAATGNALFDDPDPLLRRLKRRSTDLALAYTALRALGAYRAVGAHLTLPDARFDAPLLNLSITKRAHVTGGLRYDGVTAVDSGLADVFLAVDAGPLRRVAMMARVARGRFVGAKGARHWSVPRLSVRLDRVMDLELDGEIVQADEAELDVIAKGALVCG